MDEHRKYARARDQLYHLVVKLRQLDEEIPKTYRTPELQRCLETVVRVVEEACSAFEHGEVMAVQIDRYQQDQLPGFKDVFGEMKNPFKGDTG